MTYGLRDARTAAMAVKACLNGGRGRNEHSAGVGAGHDVRVGLEDVLVLPGGAAAASNAELVVAAVELIGGPE